MKWGLFGGTFDPIHIGHLRCAEEVRELFSLDRVFFIPAARQPLKTGQDITPYGHRGRMVRLAIDDNPAFAISDIEQERGGASYSIDTVTFFLNDAPSTCELFFILGQDSFLRFQEWKEWEELLRRCHFIVMTRPGYEMVDLPSVLTERTAAGYVYDHRSNGFTGPSGRSIYFRRLTFLEISSTEIRADLMQGRTVRYLIPDAVYRYIRTNGLYTAP